jgi:short-subunit dehydrogenase
VKWTRITQIEQVIETNMMASILLTRPLLPDMLRRRGHLVQVSSLAGKTGLPYLSVYVATKYALVGFNYCLHTELHGTGVYSSAVCPGFIVQEGMWARLNRKIHPAFGLSTPERVATAVATDWSDLDRRDLAQAAYAFWTLVVVSRGFPMGLGAPYGIKS